MGNLEVLFSGPREGKFFLYCISQVEGGRYLPFRLEVDQIVEPHLAPDRTTAVQWLQEFFEAHKDEYPDV